MGVGAGRRAEGRPGWKRPEPQGWVPEGEPTDGLMQATSPESHRPGHELRLRVATTQENASGDSSRDFDSDSAGENVCQVNH